jgi:hypothetical protein
VIIKPYKPAIKAYFEIGIQSIGTFPFVGTIIVPMDAELVFVGIGNFEWTNFTSLDAKLGLYYWNGSAWLPLPNDYDYEIATGESAFTDVNVTVNNGLFVLRAPGTFRPGLIYLPQYLVNSINTVIPRLQYLNNLFLHYIINYLSFYLYKLHVNSKVFKDVMAIAGNAI